MQQLNENQKSFCFILIVVVLSSVAFTLKEVLVRHFNALDMLLFKIDFVKNYGAAFSLFHTKTLFLIFVSLAILIATLFYIFKNIKNFSNCDLFFSAMLSSGIICNLLERLIDGFVTDYIRLTFISFPIFNLADIYISIGAFVLICNILFNNEQSSV